MLLLAALVLWAGVQAAHEELLPDGEQLSGGDYKEEKNHSDAIKKILMDFEKTLEDNKILYDRPDDENDGEPTDVARNATEPDIPETALDLATNSSIEETTNATNSSLEQPGARAKMVCNNSLPLLELAGLEPPPSVILMNGSHYQLSLAAEHNSSVVNRTTAALCSVTLFYADWCQFSATAAPHYNALARAFPQMTLYAVDSSRHHSLNTQYGVMAVPTLLVFHNSRPLYKYNYTEYGLDRFVEFLSLVTGLEAVNGTELTPEDWIGPLPSEASQPHSLELYLALAFSLLCGLLQFTKSPLARGILAGVRNAWREAEIQHEHHD